MEETSTKYVCYLEKYHELNSQLLLAKVNNTYYTFNFVQIEFLKFLNKNSKTKEELYSQFSYLGKDIIDQFIDYFYKRGIIVKKNSLENHGLKMLTIYRKFTRIYLPQKLNRFIEARSSKLVNFIPTPVFLVKLMLYLSPILSLFLCYAVYDIQLDISKVPRNIATFLVGSIAAIVHELLVMIYHLKLGKKVGRVYIRIIYFVIISFGTEWGDSYSERKEFRTTMFMFSLLSIFYLSGLFFIIYYIVLYLKLYLLAYYLSIYAVGTLIFAFINAYPFLLRTDGYMLYQEFFEIYKVRGLFFKTLFYCIGMRRNVGFKEALKKNNLKTYIWDICFIVSIIGVLFILFNGIRIII